ncbi:unnamed protein product [Rotaria sordida]|uniref:UAS domain-containing protein n=1 Tax=Rotaria sordida TaxID=392033 RepID=A0A814L9C6_9BILA|nr:unnamed protein product [Rotaria sordida]
MNLREPLIPGVNHYDFEGLAAVQQRAIKRCISDHDISVQAQSGTKKMKTSAISVLQQLDDKVKDYQVFILTSTRVSVQEIQKIVLALGHHIDVACHACIDGTNTRNDMKRLETDIQFVVGTPECVYDMLNESVPLSVTIDVNRCRLTAIHLFHLSRRAYCIPKDDDEEISDDNTFDYDSYSDECKNEVVDIECFNSCFISRYNFCPMFFPGSLQDACQAAFTSKVIKEHRPVLVYIHHDRSIFSNIFCLNIFCSEIIIEYLLENYIVWPWDITFELNKNKLIQIWREVFSTEFLNISLAEQCPMLIGIMRRSARAKDWSLTSEYEVKILLNGDTLTCTQEKLTRETLLGELINLKEEFDENEQILSFDFTTRTDLCWEVIFEITKYLSLNDAINAFSDNILSFVHKYKTKVHISEPSYVFINMIIRKIKLQQIISLHLNTNSFSKMKELNSSIIFMNVISLTLLNYQSMNSINEYKEYFPNLIRLCLWYDNQVNFDMLNKICSQFWSSIKRFEIRCNGPFGEFLSQILRQYPSQ